MPLEKHHKWMIGGASSFIILVLVVNSVFLYILYGQVQLVYSQLSRDISSLQADTQSKVNELSQSLLKTNKDLSDTARSLNVQIGTIGEDINLLKSSTSSDFSGIIEDVVKSVVTIKTDTGQGTGFIITSNGYIISNYHVVEGATTIEALTSEQKTIPIKLIGYNPPMDIALLYSSGDYSALSLEDSENIQIGEKVIAIGNPLGLQFSVSEGIVSGVNREGPSGLNVYIQTDAALNPGNSGGPLINKRGKVIGINNFKLGSGESLGFALESNAIKETVNAISLKASNQTLI